MVHAHCKKTHKLTNKPIHLNCQITYEQLNHNEFVLVYQQLVDEKMSRIL